MNRAYSDVRRSAFAFGDRLERLYCLCFVNGTGLWTERSGAYAGKCDRTFYVRLYATGL